MNAAILYLHGFCSSPASWKARLLAETLKERGQEDCFYCPELSHIPRQAIAQAEAVIRSHDGPLTLIGSSLGGYYATHLAEKHALRAALINPAVVAPISLSNYLGQQTNFYTGEVFEFTSEHIAQVRSLEVEQITPERYFLLVETGDEVLNCWQAVTRYHGARQQVFEGGDHSFTRFPECLPQLFEYCGL